MSFSNRLPSASSGDARAALHTLEIAAEAAADGVIDRQILADALQRKVLLYDKSGEEHYNLISALQKSVARAMPMRPFTGWRAC